MLKVKGEKKIFKTSEYSGEIISYIENFVDRELELAKVHKTTARQALITAIRLELSMVEKKSCEILTPLSARLDFILRRISQDCAQHISFLSRALDKMAY